MTINAAATMRPGGVVGTMSPYPTVVTVITAHQSASPIVGKSCGSTSRINTAQPTANPTMHSIRYQRMRPRSKARSKRLSASSCMRDITRTEVSTDAGRCAGHED